MPEPLTPLERRVYHYLIDFLATHSYQPSVREIAKRFRIKSTKSVSELLTSLAIKGYIRREAGRSRGVTLLGVAGAAGAQPIAVWDDPPAADLPVAGTAPRYVTLDRRLVPADDCYLLRIADSLMASRGFLAGDYALVSPSARALDGDLVAARIANLGAARILVARGAVVALQAPGVADVPAGPSDDATVLGVIAGAFRLGSGLIPTEPASTAE
jgi:repressor LexA